MAGLPLDALSLTELARKKGVSKQAIHKRVKALAASGVLAVFPGPQRSVLLSEAAFDFAIKQTGDPAREASAASAALLRLTATDAEPTATLTAPAAVAQSAPAVLTDTDTPAYRDAKARDAYYGAELKRLNFEQANKQLYRRDEVETAITRLAGAVKDVTKGLVSRAEEGAEAMDRGMPQFRRWLSLVGDDICRALASEWRITAEDAVKPAPDLTSDDGDTIDDPEA